jgi:hypothetical protein
MLPLDIWQKCCFSSGSLTIEGRKVQVFIYTNYFMEEKKKKKRFVLFLSNPPTIPSEVG